MTTQKRDLVIADREVWGRDAQKECACGCGKTVDHPFSDYCVACEDRMMEQELGPDWRQYV